MSSIRITLKLFRSNLKSTMAYLVTLILAVSMYYDFAILKYSPEMLGGGGDSTTIVVCAALMSVVMAIVFFAFVWSSSRFFLQQRKKEIGLYALCGVPMRRAGRVFLWDGLLTGLCALGGGLLLGMLLTKLFLMGAALMIKIEKPMGFTLPAPAVVETALLVLGIFLITAIRNSLVVRRSKLIELLQGMRVCEQPPKRRTLLAVLSVLALAVGYTMSMVTTIPALMGMIIVLCLPILVLVILGSYWAFEALLPGVLGKLTQNKDFFYRGMRMVGISNLWYRLRTNHRNLALTSVLSATAIVTLCTALTMSDYVGAREGKHAQRLVKAYSLTSWMPAEQEGWMQDLLNKHEVRQSQALWIPVTRVKGSDGSITMVLEQADARHAAERLMPLLNLPVPEITVPAGMAILLQNPDRLVALPSTDEDPVAVIGDSAVLPAAQPTDLWVFGGNSAIWEAVVVPDGWLSNMPRDQQEKRLFLGLQVGDKTAEALASEINQGSKDAYAELNRRLTTGARILYGTLSYLGLIMFGVFSLLTGCALLFKQLSEAMADRLKYQSMIHIGATRGELRRAVGWQVGLSLVVPLLLGFVHALFAVRVMGSVFMLPTMGYLLTSLGVYALVVLGLYLLTVNRFMKIVV